MNLVQFIDYLRFPEKVKQYLEKQYPNVDVYNAEVYMKESLDVDSELVIFDCDEIEGKIEMYYENEKYINLFTLYTLEEVFKDYANSGGTDLEIARKILDYRINDA